MICNSHLSRIRFHSQALTQLFITHWAVHLKKTLLDYHAVSFAPQQIPVAKDQNVPE